MMQRLLNTRRRFSVALIAAAAIAPALPSVASAQSTPTQTSTAQGAFKVLVMNLANKTDPKNTRFGEKASDIVRKGIGQMATHTPIAEKDVDLALKNLHVDPANFDCTMGRQLANREGIAKAQITMCGDYETDPAGGYKVSASFFTTDEAISFDVLPFHAAAEADAANTIVTQFQAYVHQLDLASACSSYVASEQWQEAIDKCAEALQINPRSTTSQYLRATALLKLNRPEEALAGYQKVLEISPINQEALRSAGAVASQLGKGDLATKYFHDYLELNPGDEQVELTIANDMNKNGNPTGAAKFLEEGLKGDTTNYSMLGSIASYWMFAASTTMKTATTDDQKAAGKALYANAIKDYELIQRNLAAAKVSHGDLDNLYRYLMQAYLQTGQNDRAAALGPAAIANDSATAGTFMVYATALGTTHQEAEASKVLDQAVAKDPTLKVAYQKALLALPSGNLDDIVKYAKQAQTEGATDEQIDAIAQQILADASKKTGSEQAALLEAGRGLAKSPKSNAMADFYQGMALYSQGTAYIPKKPAVVSKSGAQSALTLLQRARPLIAGSAAFTEAASSRAQYISVIDQTVAYLKQVIAM